MSNRTSNYLWIILLVVLLIAAPVIFVAIVLLWLAYWYRLGGKQKNAQLMTSLQNIKSTIILLALACNYSGINKRETKNKYQTNRKERE